MAFIEDRLLDKVAYGFQIGPQFQTRIRTLRNGHERRNRDASSFRWKGSAPYQNIKPEHYETLLGAFLTAGGMADSFRFKNWVDFAVTGQSLGVAPAGSTPVQLVKDYVLFGSVRYRRIIEKPVAGTVTVYEGGVAKAGTTDTTTGLFTPSTAWATLLTPAISSVTTAATGGSLASAKTYSYRASATNALGETLASTAVSVAVAAALATPVNAAFTTATTGGSLASGATYSYRVSATNALGETLASTATSIAIAAALATPVNAAFTTATTGGTLAAATYSYRVAAKNAIGRTLASTATTITTTGSTSTVTVNWGAVSGATGYDVFGRVGGSELLIASVGEVTAYTDTGSITPAGDLPAANTTATATNTVAVNWGSVTGATGYRVYGRTGGSELLIASVGAVTTYTDTGSITPAGALPSANTTATATNTATVNWGTVSGATGYKVYGRTASGELLIASVGAVTTYTDTGSVTPAGALPASNTTAPAVTADFQFDVPMRFDADWMPMTYSEWQALSGEVPLIEVFGE